MRSRQPRCGRCGSKMASLRAVERGICDTCWDRAFHYHHSRGHRHQGRIFALLLARHTHH